MEDRLLPINSFLCLLEPNGVTAPVLANAGFELAGLEIPARASNGSVLIDCLISHSDTSHMVAAEAKSGPNIEADQARKYAEIEPAVLVRSAYLTLTSPERPSAEVVYLCLEPNKDRIRLGLTKANLTYSIISVSETEMALDEGQSTSPQLRKAFADGPVRLIGPPPRIIPFDHESDVAVIKPRVLAALVEAMSQRASELTPAGLAERATPHLGLYGKRAQGAIIKKVTQAARQIAGADPSNFRFIARTGERDDMVRILRTPEDLHVRGRTQAWRAVGRPGKGRRKGGHSASDGQLDLLAELDAMDSESGDIDEMEEARA